MKGFRTFLMRGNVVDLAVGIVIGAAFSAVVKGLVDGFITPLIALAVGKPDFSGIHFDVNGTQFPIGGFIGALVTFILERCGRLFFRGTAHECADGPRQAWPSSTRPHHQAMP